MEFEAISKEGVPETSVWRYFLRGIQNRGVAKCAKCSKVIKCEGSSTSGLKKHLKGVHQINLDKRPASDDVPQDNQTATTSSHPKKIVTLHQYFSKSSPLEAALARMAAEDNIPFNTICNSEGIRLGLYARGFRDIPKSPEGIRLKVKAHYIFVVGGYRKEFGEIRKQGRKISITFDEWTSTRNRRYMNVNAHDGQHTWNLGLKRIVGSMDAEKCVKLLEEILSEYGLSLTEDVVAATTDGASVMKKVGRLIPADHQVCLAHGIHLAVTSVLYSRNEPTYNQRELSGEGLFISNCYLYN